MKPESTELLQQYTEQDVDEERLRSVVENELLTEKIVDWLLEHSSVELVAEGSLSAEEETAAELVAEGSLSAEEETAAELAPSEITEPQTEEQSTEATTESTQGE